MAAKSAAKHKAPASGRGLGILAVALATSIWGTVGPVIKMFPDGTAMQYALIRNLTGITFLWLIIAFSKNKRRYTKDDIWPIMLGGLGVAGFMPTFSQSFERTGVAVAAVLAIGMGPVFTGILSWGFFKHRPTRNWVVGTTFAIAGLVGLSWPAGGIQIDKLGVILALCAAFAYSWQAIGMQMISDRHTPFQSVAPIFTIGAILQSPISLGGDFSFLQEPKFILGCLYGGAFTVAIAYALFTIGIKRIGTATAVTVGLMEPLTAAAMGVFLLGETISPIGYLGFVAILVGLVIVSRPRDTSPTVLLEP